MSGREADEADERTIELLQRALVIEKDQTLAYRSLAARAEEAEMSDLATRFHDLHADEQHHLSRLTARILELRSVPLDLSGRRAEIVPLAGWESHVRQREAAEIELYVELLEAELDGLTRAMLEEILSVERRHASELGGKWTMA